MGKKSREKRQRRLGLPSFIDYGSETAKLWKEQIDAADRDFQSACLAIKNILLSHHAHDVYESILVSELWLPNRSSQIKHVLLTSVFISISEQQFLSQERISTYSDFTALMEKVHGLLPGFPTMEDYVPEGDWGGIKMPVNEDNLAIFYGSMVERSSDFIEAFRIRFEADSEPMQDMDNVIRLQNYLIQGIDAHASSEDEDSGHLEMPLEWFWSKLVDRLRQMDDFTKEIKITEDLIASQGALTKKKSSREFANDVLDGSGLPFLLVKINGRLFPVSPRNMPGVVIDYWGMKSKQSVKEIEGQVLKGVSQFLAGRFPSDRMKTGPYSIVTREHDQPVCDVSAFFADGDVIHVLMVAHESRLSMISSLEQNLEKVLNSSSMWGFLDVHTGMALSPRPIGSVGAVNFEFRILVIIPTNSTASKPVRLPKANAKFMFLSDFITIFDSVESIHELLVFLEFHKKNLHLVMSMMTSWSDIYSAFKSSGGLLVGGAIIPTTIMLDPHMGSNWRYEELAKFWRAAPVVFPNSSPRSWLVDSSDGATRRMISKVSGDYCESIQIGGCTLHFMSNPDESELDSEGTRFVLTFTECVADSISQRIDHISSLDLFNRRKIVTFFRPLPNASFDSDNQDGRGSSNELFSGWEIISEENHNIIVTVKFDLCLFVDGLNDAVDASFEAMCAEQWLSGMASLVGAPLDSQVIEYLRATRDRQPRFAVSKIQRTVDLPIQANPANPMPQDYKLARRDLAVAFKNAGVKPSHYELEDAKKVIDPVRDAYRNEVHAAILMFPRMELVRFALEQFEAQIAEYDTHLRRLNISLSHQVEFDRTEEWIKVNGEFLRQSKNTRYLIECALSMEASGTTEVSRDLVRTLLAKIDWMIVLYDASDSIHNDVNAGGVDIDSEYVPSVFYLKEDDNDGGYKEEMGRHALGYELVQFDEPEKLTEQERYELNSAFNMDAGFELNQLLQVLIIMKQWHSIQGRTDMQFSYSAPIDSIVNVAASNFDDLGEAVVKKIIDFLLIKPDKIRVLSGRELPEGDVPIWEHRKRTHRLTIRPLISLGDGNLLWGAGLADRAFRVWAGALSEGYLPSDFAWPSVISVVEKIKVRIESEIEHKAGAICSRFTDFCETGLDLKSRFPRDILDGIGDYDVLAFWPAINHWVMVECKYNKPPFAMKDARRLREKIFDNDGHLYKIIRRKIYLENNSEKIRNLLGWPVPADVPVVISDLYVSPHLYYWMRNPPYAVTTQFVKLSALDFWIRSNIRI